MKTSAVHLLGAMSVASALFLSACGPRADSDGLVEFTFHEGVDVLNYGTYEGFKSDVDGKAVVYLTGPTLFYIEDDFMYLYLPEDGSQIEIRGEGDLLFVNDIVRVISPQSKERDDLKAWIAAADDAALKGPRVMDPDGWSDDELKKINTANPHVFSMDEYDDWIARDSQPFLVVLGYPTNDAYYAEMIQEMDLSETRVVYVEEEVGPLAVEALARKSMPKLYRLIISEDANGKDLVAALPRIRALTWCNQDELPALAPLARLVELHIFRGDEDDSITDLGQLPNPEALRALSLTTTNATLGLERLTGLEYINPGGAMLSDNDLAAILSRHPKLIFLNLIYASVESLEPLRNATGLKALVLGELDPDATPDLAPLGTLNNLRFMGLPKKTLETGTAEEIRTLCPQAVLYKHDKFCLGAGWLAAFIPLLLLIVLLKRRASKSIEGA